MADQMPQFCGNLPPRYEDVQPKKRLNEIQKSIPEPMPKDFF